MMRKEKGKKMEERKENQVPEVGVKEKNRKKKRNRKIIIGGSVGVVVLLLVLAKIFTPPALPLVFVTTPTIGAIEDKLDTSGTLKSENEKVYYSPVNAPVLTSDAVMGRSVKEGDQLVTFDVTDLENQNKQAELDNEASQYGYKDSVNKSSEGRSKYNNAASNVNNLENAIASKQQEILNLEVAIANANNAAGIEGGLGGLTDNDVALKEAQLDLADLQTALGEEQGKMSSGEAAILTQDQLNQLQANNNKAEIMASTAAELVEKGREGIVAEFDGVISKSAVQPGVMAAQGMELFTLSSNKDIYVDISVSKYDFSKIKEGQSAQIKVGDTTYDGEVSFIDKIATTNEKGVTLIGARVKINNPDENIYLGVEAKISILVAQAKDVLLLPTEAVNINKEGSFCYVVEDGIIVKKEVKTGISSMDSVEITEGISIGDTVMLGNTAELPEGTKVRTMEDLTKADESKENVKETQESTALETQESSKEEK